MLRYLVRYESSYEVRKRDQVKVKDLENLHDINYINIRLKVTAPSLNQPECVTDYTAFQRHKQG